MSGKFDFKLAHICGKKKRNMDLHFPGGLSTGLAHICASRHEAPKPWVALVWRGMRRRSGLIWILIIKDIIIVMKIWIRGCCVFNVLWKSAKLFYLKLSVPLLAAHPHLWGARDRASAGLGYCLAGNLSGQAHLSRPETFSSEPVSQHPGRKHCGSGVRRLAVQPLKMRHQPYFFLTAVVICNDPMLSKNESCSQSCLCNCVYKASGNI